MVITAEKRGDYICSFRIESQCPYDQYFIQVANAAVDKRDWFVRYYGGYRVAGLYGERLVRYPKMPRQWPRQAWEVLKAGITPLRSYSDMKSYL